MLLTAGTAWTFFLGGLARWMVGFSKPAYKVMSFIWAFSYVPYFCPPSSLPLFPSSPTFLLLLPFLPAVACLCFHATLVLLPSFSPPHKIFCSSHDLPSNLINYMPPTHIYKQIYTYIYIH